MSAPPPKRKRPPMKRKRKGPGKPSAATAAPSRPRRLKLRHLIFLVLLFSGIIPLLVSSVRMIGESRELLKTKETELLHHRAQAFADRLSQDISFAKKQLRQLGMGFVAMESDGVLVERFNTERAESYFRNFADDHPELYALFVVDQNLRGITVVNKMPQIEAVAAKVNEGLATTRDTGDPVYRFVSLSEQETAVIVAQSVRAGEEETLILETLVPLRLKTELLAGSEEDQSREELFLIDGAGHLLWSPGSSPQKEQALLASDLVATFAQMPFSASQEFDLPVGKELVPTLARVVQVQETGWGVVAHKPIKFAFDEVRRMVVNAVISSVVLVILAMVFALIAARSLSRPIQRMVQASHEIAAGNFERRVSTKGLGMEVADLADDFNRMSEYVENYIEQLRKAAEANRALFISTIRAFAATIDAKDPYTRGHSERVAAYSRSIARYLGLPKDMQERVWISAVLHDVGKIGVEDRILKKVGVLTPEEFEQMKLHPAIGAEIVEPIAALREMIPGIRWHHEAWNGSGYPDKLKGEQIPLMARIIGVADTFDAITTTRPYQNAYSTDYALQTIKKLTGKKFDAKIVTAFLLAYEAGHIKVDKEEADFATSKIKVPTAVEAVAG